MATFTDPCPKVLAQVKLDARRGNTTSEKAKDFIRRTCRCDSCSEARKAMPAATAPWARSAS